MKLKKILFIACLLLSAIEIYGQEKTWVGTWASASEFTGPSDMPKTDLSNHSLRQIIHVSLGGSTVRIKLSNEFSKTPVNIKSIYIAPFQGDNQEVINPKTVRYFTFGKKKQVSIEGGKAVYSDPLKFNLEALSKLSITINYGDAAPVNMTSHRGSRTTSYIAEGVVNPKNTFSSVEKLDHWYNIAALEVIKDANVKAIAILGNSITDGRGSTTNFQNRWPDKLMEATNGEVGVLNLGIGGNCVVSGGLSQPALVRFDRDILGQKGVDKLIIFEGTNDIGISKGNSEFVADTLIGAYKTLIAMARKAGMKVYGATITPFKGNGWYSFFHDAARMTVNEWIRTSGAFDEIIDFDKLVRDPQHPDQLKPEYSEDWLHLNPKGYEAMGKYAAEILKK